MPAELPAELVLAAGGAVWRTAADGSLETAVVHRPKYDDWSLPKGKLDRDEHALHAAVREVNEETGLAGALSLFAPTAVLSAERTRCRQTVQPLAERLGLSVLPCHELGEEEFQADPQAGLALVERLLEPRNRPGVTVVCSQGGAIPSV